MLKNSFFLIVSFFGNLHAQNFTPGTEALYYGFFFNEEIANSIKNITDTYFQTCILQIPQFKTFMEANALKEDVKDINDFYTKPLDPNEQTFDPFYHVTAKYCGDLDCTEYRNFVEPQINETFEMHLIGYYFTNRTFGIRVKLTADQEKLFDNEDGKRLEKEKQFTKHENFEVHSLPGIRLENIPEDFNPTSNKPHITIGTAPKVSAVTTGTDLVEIIKYEKDAANFQAANYTLRIIDMGNDLDDTEAVVIHYVDVVLGDAFVVYPKVKVLTDAKFQPYLKKETSPSFSSSFIPSVYLTAILFGLAAFKLHYDMS